MENKTRKKLNGIEKICLVGTIAGMSLFVTGAVLNKFSTDYDKNKTNLLYSGAILYVASFMGHAIASRKSKELEQKNYYYKN